MSHALAFQKKLPAMTNDNYKIYYGHKDSARIYTREKINIKLDFRFSSPSLSRSVLKLR